MRSVLSAVLFIHGLVHVVGFMGPLELVPATAFQTVLFGRSIPNTSAAGRSMAVFWLALALAFSVASVALLVRATWWFPYTVALLSTSLLLCLATWPMTKAGAALNVGLILSCLLLERAQLWSDVLGLLRTLRF